MLVSGSVNHNPFGGGGLIWRENRCILFGASNNHLLGPVRVGSVFLDDYRVGVLFGRNPKPKARPNLKTGKTKKKNKSQRECLKRADEENNAWFQMKTIHRWLALRP